MEIAAFVGGDKTQILVYAQNAKPTADEQFGVRIRVNCRAKEVLKAAIDDSRCNPKGEWEKLGKPDILTSAQVERIKQNTALKLESIPFSLEGEDTVIEITLRTNDVVMLTIG